MVENIQAHIGSLNWGYRVALRDKNVKYINAFATLEDAHTVKVMVKLIKQEKGCIINHENALYSVQNVDKFTCYFLTLGQALLILPVLSFSMLTSVGRKEP